VMSQADIVDTCRRTSWTPGRPGGRREAGSPEGPGSAGGRVAAAGSDESLTTTVFEGAIGTTRRSSASRSRTSWSDSWKRRCRRWPRCAHGGRLGMTARRVGCTSATGPVRGAPDAVRHSPDGLVAEVPARPSGLYASRRRRASGRLRAAAAVLERAEHHLVHGRGDGPGAITSSAGRR